MCTLVGVPTSIVAVDPGVTSGYFYRNNLSSLVVMQETSDKNQLLFWLSRNVLANTALVVENFVITEATAGADTSTIGLVQEIERLFKDKAKLFEKRLPSEKRMRTDKQLKALEWYQRGGGGHANDAARHALSCMISRQWLGREENELLKSLW